MTVALAQLESAAPARHVDGLDRGPSVHPRCSAPNLDVIAAQLVATQTFGRMDVGLARLSGRGPCRR